MRRVESTSFEDDEDEITVKKLENLKVVNIYKNYNDEIIIVQEKKVGLLYIWDIYLRIKEFIYL